jgi:protein O-mannosyl-transferase
MVGHNSSVDTKRLWLTAGLLACIMAGYAPAVGGEFIGDDFGSVVHNPSIRDLGNLRQVLSPPVEGGTGGRPLANLSFALNFAVTGLSAPAFRLANIGLHALTALLLAAVVRRVLEFPGTNGRLRANRESTAFFTALLWSLHPLSSSTVNYVAQRTEILFALCLLGTLYGFARGVTGSRRWWLVAIGSCALGMASKETMVIAPVVVATLDRALLAPSWRRLLQERGGFYLALSATWALLAGLILASDLAARGVGPGMGLGPLDYAVSQARALVIYVSRAIWPDPLVFDYGLAFPKSVGEVWPQIIFAVFGALALCAALWRRPQAALLPALAALVLAPTSSVIPILQQPIAENRMYVPLAALCVGGVLIVQMAAARRGWPVLSGAALALATLTMQRHEVFRTELRVWSDVVARLPDNARAHNNRAAALLRSGQPQSAHASAMRAIALAPRYADAHQNAGLALAQLDRVENAIAALQRAIAFAPESADAHYNLGVVAAKAGRWGEALAALRKCVQLAPGHIDAHLNLSVVTLEAGDAAAAAEWARRTLRLDPSRAAAHYNLGNASFKLGDSEAAERAYREALQQDPGFARAHHNIGALRLRAGDAVAAIQHFTAAIHLQPDYPEARRNLEIAQRALAARAGTERSPP